MADVIKKTFFYFHVKLFLSHVLFKKNKKIWKKLKKVLAFILHILYNNFCRKERQQKLKTSAISSAGRAPDS